MNKGPRTDTHAAELGVGRTGRAGARTHELYTRFGPQIYAYCLARLRSREEAEDALQTTFLNVFRALERGTETHAQQAWVYAIAKNVCGARRTSAAKRLLFEAPSDFETIQEVVPAPHDGEADELIGLGDALEAMPQNQRRAVLLREWQGLSYREIAAELGLTQTAVEMLIFRGRRALAKALDQPRHQAQAPDRGELVAG